MGGMRIFYQQNQAQALLRGDTNKDPLPQPSPTEDGGGGSPVPLHGAAPGGG